MALSIGIIVAMQWIGLSIMAGVIAQHKGRFGPGFGVLALLLSPLVGLLVAYVVAPNSRTRAARPLVSHASTRCTACGELLHQDATVCGLCGGEASSAVLARAPLGRTAAGSPPPNAFWSPLTGE